MRLTLRQCLKRQPIIRGRKNSRSTLKILLILSILSIPIKTKAEMICIDKTVTLLSSHWTPELIQETHSTTQEQTPKASSTTHDMTTNKTRDTIKGKIPAILGTILDTIREVVNTIPDMIQEVVSTIQDMIQKASTTIRDMIIHGVMTLGIPMTHVRTEEASIMIHDMTLTAAIMMRVMPRPIDIGVGTITRTIIDHQAGLIMIMIAIIREDTRTIGTGPALEQAPRRITIDHVPDRHQDKAMRTDRGHSKAKGHRQDKVRPDKAVFMHFMVITYIVFVNIYMLISISFYARWFGRLLCNSEIMGSNPTQGQTQGFDLNNIARASVNTESLCIPMSQIQ